MRQSRGQGVIAALMVVGFLVGFVVWGWPVAKSLATESGWLSPPPPSDLDLLRAEVALLKLDAAGSKFAAEVDANKLRNCLEDAEDARWNHVKLNGGRPSKTQPGVMTAPRDLWDSALKIKNTKIEECKVLYRR